MSEERLGEHPVLVAQAGPLKGQRWAIDRPLLIGREATCDVVVPDRQVSRFHARLVPSAEGVILEDLGSKNGTHRNGNLVEQQIVLEDGDLLQIALAQQFIYLTSDATMPLPEADLRPGRLRLDLRSRTVWIGPRQIDPPLSALQFRVLQVLVENQGQVIDRQRLIAEAWGEEQAAGVSDQALDALLRRLRDRIAALDPSHAYIVTVRGHGVRFDNPPAS
ncbi:MAG: FHA domain-containing protein [Anaerolineales bacterium]